MERRSMAPAELADRAGISPMTVSHILNGTTRRPTMETLIALSDVFSVDLDVLLEASGVRVKRSTPGDELARLKALIDNDPMLAEIAEAAHELSAPELRGVLAYIEAVKKQKSAE